MTDIQLRTRIKRQVESLSPERLRVAADFLSYLAEREDNPATRELLTIPHLLRDIKAGERQVARGRYRNWREVRGRV